MQHSVIYAGALHTHVFSHLVALFVGILQQLGAARALCFKHGFGSVHGQWSHTHVREGTRSHQGQNTCSLHGIVHKETCMLSKMDSAKTILMMSVRERCRARSSRAGGGQICVLVHVIFTYNSTKM
jgi:hypothetical protein